ncbi:MAG: tol-pal system protein YbgF, partial [Cytophagaceae bacterium]
MVKAILVSVLLVSTNLFAQTDSLPYMLLMDEKIQIEATDAVNDMYNFKFDKAERQFQIYKLKYPDHPLPYFLMGLSTWWRMMPNLEHELDDTKHDDIFLAYMDTAITCAEKMYKANEKNVEAVFFLAGAYGFKARLFGERSNYTRGTFAAKNALKYLRLMKDNELSPEFLFGEGLYNYYAPWVKENYPLLRPIIILFPNGDKELGIKQLKQVSYNAFYTRTEAQFWLVRIYTVEEENKEALAMPFARYLGTTFPDNPIFQRNYARTAYITHQMGEASVTAAQILKKIEEGMPGYEENAGRIASFIMGEYYYTLGDIPKAKEYYNKAIEFAKKIDEIHTGYYLWSMARLATIAENENQKKEAKVYWKQVKKDADKDNKKVKE